MPRTPITTSYTPRVKPSSSWSAPRTTGIWLWQSPDFSWDVWFLIWQFTGSPINTLYNTPRTKVRGLLTDYWLNTLTDYNGNELSDIDTFPINKITTNYS